MAKKKPAVESQPTQGDATPAAEGSPPPASGHHRITFEQTLMAARQNYRRRHTYYVPADEAQEYIDKGLAKSAEEE